MSGVEFQKVVKKFGDTQVVHGVDLKIEDGKFCVFVGPSGCGKSTLLRMVAGLEELSDGKILIGNKDVTDLEPSDRGIAMVFQTYALYPHMTVADNIGFSLKMNKVPQAEIDKKVTEAADILKLNEYLDRQPKALSGGQRQRVAIGRAIVRGPEVFLFDEPLSNLDAELRVEMRVEIARLHKNIGATMIYVTHDQVEAMTLADQIVVLRKGVIEQVGAPMELYKNPANRFVAGFIGSPSMNFFNAVYEDGKIKSAGLGNYAFTPNFNAPLTSGTKVILGIRPNDIKITASEDSQLVLDISEHLGGVTYDYITTPTGEKLIVESPSEENITLGTKVDFSFPTEKTYLFNAETEERIY